MNKLALAIVVILFPGIIATIISDKITVHNTKWGSFKYGMYSFVLGTSCYILLQFILFFFNAAFCLFSNTGSTTWSHLKIWNIITDNEVKTKLSEIGQATMMSVPVAFFASFLINYKVFNKLSRKLGISNKYGDENLFSFYLNSDEVDWVYVRDAESDVTYQGRINSYSENNDIQELVLYNVTVYSYEESDELYSLPSIYLCKKMGSFVIESIPQELLEEYDEESES